MTIGHMRARHTHDDGWSGFGRVWSRTRCQMSWMEQLRRYQPRPPSSEARYQLGWFPSAEAAFRGRPHRRKLTTSRRGDRVTEDCPLCRDGSHRERVRSCPECRRDQSAQQERTAVGRPPAGRSDENQISPSILVSIRVRRRGLVVWTRMLKGLRSQPSYRAGCCSISCLLLLLAPLACILGLPLLFLHRTG